MNDKQRDSAAKYLYDTSKGVLLAAVVALFTDKIGWAVFFAHLGAAFFTFLMANWLEE